MQRFVLKSFLLRGAEYLEGLGRETTTPFSSQVGEAGEGGESLLSQHND